MSQNSTIEWTNATWNPVRGCDKVSPGCKYCYAETFAERFRGVPGHPFEQGFDLRLVPEKLDEPKKWRKGKKIFVNSMSDLFHKDVPTDYIRQVCDVMLEADHHEYQVLTKRPERLKDLLSTAKFADAASAGHILWGVSVEDRKCGLPRIDLLRATPVRRRFLSIEPLLEDLGEVDLSGIDWIIVGGESGAGARPFALEWAVSLIGSARKYGVPIFIKQMGRKPTLDGDPFVIIDQNGNRDAKGKTIEAWPEYLRVREFPTQDGGGV